MEARFSAAARLAATMLALLVVGVPAQAGAQAVLREGFEKPELLWTDAGGNASYTLARHEHTNAGAHTGTGCEFLEIAASNGSYIYLRYPLGQARVIAELEPAVWLRSDRPGLQILAHVVFPRAIDSTTGQPMAVTIPGDVYARPGNWQRLRVMGAPHLVEQQARVLRAQNRAEVDTREAFIDALMVNVYGGEGKTKVWLDDVEVPGFVGRQAPSSAATALAAETATPPTTVVGTVQLNGSLLEVNGHPMFPRMIEYRGEPLRFLQARGFNALKLAEPPTKELLAEAAELGLWIVAPPPHAASAAGDDVNVPTLGPEYGPVLAWDLGHNLQSTDLETTRRLAQQVRRASLKQSRPLVCEPIGNVAAFTRVANLMWLDRSPLGSTLELSDYATWLAERPRLARPGTPAWVTVQTQLPAEANEQIVRMSGAVPEGAGAQAEQIRLLTYCALSAGARGVCFQSFTPLDAQDADTRRRSMTLELLNLELEILEPWIAAGSVAGRITGSDPQVRATLLELERSRVLLPMWIDRGGQFVPGQSAANGLNLVVPGVPEDHEVYEITPAGLRPLRSYQRVTRGTRIMLDEMSLTGLLLFTQDPLVIHNITQRLNQSARHAAMLEQELARQKLAITSSVFARLEPSARPTKGSTVWLAEAQEKQQLVDKLLAAGDFHGAYLAARRSERPARLLERACWQQAVSSLGSPVVTPQATRFATLPEHYALLAGLGLTQSAANQLQAGDFENLDALLAAGWQHLQHPADGVKTTAELSPQQPHGGRFSLRLTATPEHADRPPSLVETPPITVVSPSITVVPSQVVRITGWIRIAALIRGSVDGVLIYDSCGGPGLAERIGQTSGWRTFSFYRAATEEGKISVTVALTGLGDVWIDDLSIVPIVRPALPASRNQLTGGK